MKTIILIFSVFLIPLYCFADYSPTDFKQGEWVAFYSNNYVCPHFEYELHRHTPECSSNPFLTNWFLGVVTKVRPESLEIDALNLNGEMISGLYDESFWIQHYAGYTRYHNTSASSFFIFFGSYNHSSYHSVSYQGERVQKKVNAVHSITLNRNEIYDSRQIQKISHKKSHGTFSKNEIVYLNAHPYTSRFFVYNPSSYTKVKFVIDGWTENGKAILHPLGVIPEAHIYRIADVQHLVKTGEGIFSAQLNFDEYRDQIKERK